MSEQYREGEIDKKALSLAEKAVVGIERIEKGENGSRTYRSGWLYDNQGHIVTSAYYLEDVESLKISFWNTEDREAKLIGRNYASGVGILKVEGDLPKPFIQGDSTKCNIGENIWIIGFPVAKKGKKLIQRLPEKVSSGTLTDKDKSNINYLQIENYLQFDISIDSGTLGGTMINASGEIIGMVVKSVDEGISLASPIESLKETIEKVIKEEPIKRGYLGIGISPITPFLKEKFHIQSEEGMLVEYLIPSSPSEKAGLKKGDLIQKIDGKALSSSYLYQREVMSKEIGQEFELTIQRGKEQLQFRIKSEERPEKIFMHPFDEFEQYYGILLQEQTEGFVSEQGLKILDMLPGSLAQTKEFEIGDLIYKIDDLYLVSTEKDFNEILEKKEGHSKGRSFYASFKIRKKDGEKRSFYYSSYFTKYYEPMVM